MTNRPRGETLQTGQFDESIRRDLEVDLQQLEEGNRYIFFSLIRDLENSGETRFLSDLLKIQFDQTFEDFRESLKTQKMHVIDGTSGHNGMHTIGLYETHQGKIPELETELRKRGDAIMNLRNVHYGDNYWKAVEYYESIGLAEQAEKAKKAMVLKKIANAGGCDGATYYIREYIPEEMPELVTKFQDHEMTEEEFRAFQKQYGEMHNQLIKEEMERLVNLFDTPMLDETAKEKTVEEIKEAIRKKLGR